MGQQVREGEGWSYTHPDYLTRILESHGCGHMVEMYAYARICRKTMEQISTKNTEGKPISGGQLFLKVSF
jgi:hypothetical protein